MAGVPPAPSSSAQDPAPIVAPRPSSTVALVVHEFVAETYPSAKAPISTAMLSSLNHLSLVAKQMSAATRAATPSRSRSVGAGIFQ